jgi:hypothetical protein
MAACPFLTGVATFRCLARSNFVIPSITEETRYCLSKHPERCPHYNGARTEKPEMRSQKTGYRDAARANRGARTR